MNASISTSRHLLGLPIETQLAILSYLGFCDILRISRVCQDLRQLCLAECRLWQEFPPVTMATLHTVTPYFDRAGQLGRDLFIHGIKQADLGLLSRLLTQILPFMRSLHLDFAASSEWDVIDIPAMRALWLSLSQPAPLLESLALVTADLHDPIHTVPFDIFGGAPLPELRSLELTAFRLEESVAAFAHVEYVRTCITVLAPFSQVQLPSLANPEWENRRLHEHFPAIRSLVLLAIEPADGDELAHSILRLPCIDEPLAELYLGWDGDDDFSDDLLTVRWMEQSINQVTNVAVQYAESLPVSIAVLLSLATAGPMTLCIVSSAEGEYHLIAGSENGRQRRVAVKGEDVATALEKILRHPLVVVTSVWISAHDALVKIIAQHWICSQQTSLGIIVGPRRDEIECPMGDGPISIPSDLMEFVKKCTPNAHRIRLIGKVTLRNAEVIPETIALELRDD